MVGLRERKKQLTRRQLSDTATAMFLDRGFDAVRVAEVAEACGVSEKTVFNYFPTKESLLLDRWDDTVATLRTVLADPDLSPVEATLRVLAEDLGAVTAGSMREVHRFGVLIRSTPSLRAHRRDLADQLAAVLAEAVAGRAGLPGDDPEPQIVASALLGLWEIQARGLVAHTAGDRTPAQVREAVTADVVRAARILDAGLPSYRGSASRGSAPRGSARSTA